MDDIPGIGNGGIRINPEQGKPKVAPKLGSGSFSKYKIVQEPSSSESQEIKNPKVVKKPGVKDQMVQRIFSLFGGNSKSGDLKKVHVELDKDPEKIDVEFDQEVDVESTTGEATNSSRSSSSQETGEDYASILENLEHRAVLLRMELEDVTPKNSEKKPIEDRIQDLLHEVESIPVFEKPSIHQSLEQMQVTLAQISDLQTQQDALYEKRMRLPNVPLLRETNVCQIMNLQLELSIRYEELFSHMEQIEDALRCKEYELDRVPMAKRENLSPLNAAQILIMQKSSPLEVVDFEPLNTDFMAKKTEVMQIYQERFIKFTGLDMPSTRYPRSRPQFGETLSDHRKLAFSEFKYVSKEYDRKLTNVSRLYEESSLEFQDAVPSMHFSSDQSLEDEQLEISRFFSDIASALKPK